MAVKGLTAVLVFCALAVNGWAASPEEDTISLFDLKLRVEKARESELPNLKDDLLSGIQLDLNSLETELATILENEFAAVFSGSTRAVSETVEAKAAAIRRAAEATYGPRFSQLEAEISLSVSQSAIESGLPLQKVSTLVAITRNSLNTQMQSLEKLPMTATACDIAFTSEKESTLETSILMKGKVTTKVKGVILDVLKTSAVAKAMATPVSENVIPANWIVKTYGAMNEGCDNCQITQLTYNKLSDDTSLWIKIATSSRCIGNGQTCRFYIRVDGSDCRSPDNSGNGAIEARFHGSQYVNLHRDFNLEGACMRKASGKIGKGSHIISIHVEGNGDAYFGWDSRSQFSVREMRAPSWTN